MKNIINLFIYFLLLNTLINNKLECQKFKFDWAKSAIGTQEEEPKIIKFDLKGNIYIVGEFNSKNLNVGGHIISKGNTVHDLVLNVFLIKYNADGTVIWAKSIKAQDHAAIAGIDIDLENNIILSIYADNNYLDLDSVRVYSKKASNMVIAKYSERGKLIWAKSLGCDHVLDGIGGLVVDSDNNFYISGYYGATIYDDDGTVIVERKIIDVDEGYIMKFNNNGKFLWIKTITGPKFEHIRSMTLDKNQNIILYGQFGGKSMSIDSLTIENSGDLQSFGNYYYDIFLIKLNKDGKAMWIKSLNGKRNEWPNFKIMTDQENNIYATGAFESDTIYFSNSKYELKNKTNPLNFADLFYSKFDPDGNLIWAKVMHNGIIEIDHLMLEVEPNGNFFIGSNYDNTVFKTGNLVLPENKGLNDVFILYCNADGKILSHMTFGGKDLDWIKDAVKDQNDDLYILGMYLSDTLYIGSNLLINSNTDRSSDLYIAKLSKDSLNYIRPIVKSKSISVHPNPASNHLFLTIPNNWDENKNIIISLIDNLGKDIKLSSEKISKYEYSINTKLLNNGVYYLKIISGENSEVVKIMIQH
jgi:hypothetical protein